MAQTIISKKVYSILVDNAEVVGEAIRSESY